MHQHTVFADGDNTGGTIIVPFVVRALIVPMYVLLTTFTQQGVENVRDGPERTEHAKEMVESLGGTWQEFFVTMGRYDGVVIADFPDDATAAQAVLTLAESGFSNIIKPRSEVVIECRYRSDEYNL